MDKKVLGIIVVILVVGAIVAGIAIANKNKNSGNTNTNEATNSNVATREIKTTANADITLYYGQGCPHCKKVEDAIIAENIDQKVPLQMKEVWYDKNNSDDMSAKATICKIPEDKLGVPFLFDAKTGTCYTGDQDVTKFLEDQASKANSNADNTNSANVNVNTNSANTNTNS